MKVLSLILSVSLGQAAFADTSTQRMLDAGMTPTRQVIVAAMDRSGRVDIESALKIKAKQGDELVDLGSITKTVTAVATLHLIEEHGLSVHSTLADVLPNVPPDKARITLHQLLTHTAGIIESTGDDGEPLSRSAFLRRVLKAPLETKPGTIYSYSNAGYSLLAAIIELQSGMDFEDYVIERVLPEGSAPIGYARAYERDRSITSGRHWLTGFQHRPIAQASWGGGEPGWNLVGNGGLVTSAEGFLGFWKAFVGGEIVDRRLVEAALTPHVDEGKGDTFYGYGLVTETLASGEKTYWHDGGNEVFSAEWRHSADTGVTLFSAGRGRAAFKAMSAMWARK